MSPYSLSDSDFYKFMQYSSGFFFSNSKLWHCDTHGRHKIVVPKEKRYKLLKEVHDILGHRKIYAMRMQLLERFWWPFLNQDVKWFVQTCHQCQVHQMHYHHILPTVAAPASLFRKAHVDTMYMPRASGYHYIIQACCSQLSYPEHWKCKGTSVHFLTSPLLSYSPPVHMYSPSSPLYHLQGLQPKPMTSIPTV
jgi:hypothetical protein